MALNEAKPFGKDSQVGTGRPRRTSRKRATKADWRELHGAKGGPCRLCGNAQYTLHHTVPRSLGGGDTFDCLVPLCGSGTTGCHGLVENRDAATLRKLAESLTSGEYAYCIEMLGENAMERLFGVTYESPNGAK